MVYLPTFTIKSTIHVGKYTSPMDGMGNYIKYYKCSSSKDDGFNPRKPRPVV